MGIYIKGDSVARVGQGIVGGKRNLDPVADAADIKNYEIRCFIGQFFQ